MQQEAVKTALGGGVLVITGGPGTGKTTIMKIIMDIFQSHEYKIALCAPTGKAAKRLSESCGMEAKTLHRLLEVEVKDTQNQRFARNEYNPIDADVVIVDEMSMVDIILFGSLLKALKRGTCLIMAGDSDQLPSVGAGNVLHDMLESAVIPSVRLNEVFRQAEQSRIVTNAHRINMGEMPLENDSKTDFFFMNRTPDGALETICELCSGRLGKAYGFDSINDIQVLSPSRKGIVGTINLNKVLQGKLNPPSSEKKEKKFGERIFRTGDKVIQTRNNYDMLWSLPDGSGDGFGIYNGDIGTILDISSKEKSMRILFDDNKIVEYDFSSVEDLEMAYALTVHKSQGSEWSAVIIPVCSFPPMLMTRNLLYTAVTRGKKLVILVGSLTSVSQMVNNNKLQKRYSSLGKRLKEAFKND
jgi:exodeoxyribonuclease V alpha subunit